MMFNDREPVRFLDEEGNWDPSASAAEFAAELDDVGVPDLQAWYRAMVTTRAFDSECTNLQRQGQLALWAPSVGQEGCQVGFAFAAEPDDHFFPTYREHAIAHVRGVRFLDIAKQFRGITHGGWDVTDPANGNMHLYTIVLGAQTQHASGHALGQVLDAKRAAGVASLDPGEPGIPTGAASIALYGDGTTSQGEVSEAMVFATSYQTPLLMIVQNNRWAISVPVERQSRTPIYRRALGFGMKSVQVDGNDPLASYAVARQYLRGARTGDGPAFIEALTYRMGAHTTSDDPSKYRDGDEVEAWQRRDPITRLETYLRGQDVSDDFFEEVRETARRDILEVREGILALEHPEPDAMFAHVYAEDHPVIAEQRAWLAEYEASFEEE